MPVILIIRFFLFHSKHIESEAEVEGEVVVPINQALFRLTTLVSEKMEFCFKLLSLSINIILYFHMGVIPRIEIFEIEGFDISLSICTSLRSSLICRSWVHR